MMTETALRLAPLFTAYLLKVECRCCGNAVNPDKSDAANEAEHQILCCGARSIDDLRGNLRRICSYCDHVLNKDD
jgi:hypothetical protein